MWAFSVPGSECRAIRGRDGKRSNKKPGTAAGFFIDTTQCARLPTRPDIHTPVGARAKSSPRLRGRW
jgi:hypothetical protein